MKKHLLSEIKFKDYLYLLEEQEDIMENDEEIFQSDLRRRRKNVLEVFHNN